jgi:hypothetical protein
MYLCGTRSPRGRRNVRKSQRLDPQSPAICAGSAPPILSRPSSLGSSVFTRLVLFVSDPGWDSTCELVAPLLLGDGEEIVHGGETGGLPGGGEPASEGSADRSRLRRPPDAGTLASCAAPPRLDPAFPGVAPEVIAAYSSLIARRRWTAARSVGSIVAKESAISGCAIPGSRRSRSTASKGGDGPSWRLSRGTRRCARSPSRRSSWTLPGSGGGSPQASFDDVFGLIEARRVPLP